MVKVKSSILGICTLLCCCLLLVFSSCASTAPAQTSGSSGSSPEDAMAMAQAALDRMDGKEPAAAPGSPSSQSAGTQSPPPAQQEVAVNTSRTKPAWVDSVESVYGRAQYVAAVGYASNRAMAERNALANLTAIFGQSIQADMTITNTYNEAVRNGAAAQWTENTSIRDNIRTTASMDTLVGAEIREVWYDSKSTYYAAAVMDKAKTAQLYNDMIKSNQEMITNLTTMSTAEKNTLEGFARYQFAATVADINVTYGNVLRLIGAALPSGLNGGDPYRLEARTIAGTIAIRIAVKNDKSGRIQAAFAKSLSAVGLQSGGNNSRYVLEVDVVVSEVDLPNPNNYKYSRMEMTANLTDANLKTVLIPYNFNTREGHLNQSEAENRTYIAAERKINEEYNEVFSTYIYSLRRRN